MQKIVKKIIKNAKNPVAKKRGLFVNRKGMSLVELLLAIFVFSIVITASVSVAIAYLKGSTNIKKYQENTEELSMTINYISKDIRMSNTYTTGVFAPNMTKTITLKNNSDAATDIKYTFTTATGTPPNVLQKTVGAGAPETVASNVDGSFYVVRADPTKIPLITIAIWKLPVNPYLGDSVQTTVSMRSEYL